MDVIHLNFSKGFDKAIGKVPNGRLVKKVRSHGNPDVRANCIQK